MSVCTYYDKYVTYRIEGTESFEEFYAAMSGFCFRTDNDIPELIKGCRSDSLPESSESVIYVLHKWNDDTTMYSEMLSRNMIPQTLFMVTGDPEGSGQGAVPSAVGYRFLGYEDRLNEVLR